MFYTTSNLSTSHSTGLLSTHFDSESSLLSNNSNNSAPSLLSPANDSGIDVGSIGGKDILFGNPDLSNIGTSFMASAPHTETAGSIAFNGVETAGSIAFGGVETAGSLACAGAETAGSVACGGGDGGGCGGGGFSSFC